MSDLRLVQTIIIALLGVAFICYLSRKNVRLETKSDISLEKGLPGILPCTFNVMPKVVTWKKGPTYSSAKIIVAIDSVGKISGPGYEKKKFKITADYSLVFFNVTIEDEGQYFCELLQVNTDTIVRGSTNVNVFARPIKQFPVIEKCSTTEDDSNCILTVDSSVILTCHVNEYYPDIGLYFKHGSKEIAAHDTQTRNNIDGTKNKSVAIIGSISHEVYRCIAMKIPGVDGSRSTSVLLVRRNGSLNLVAIIVPIVSLVVIAAMVLPWIFLRRRDPVAYVELWELVGYAFKQNESDFLGDVITALYNHGNECPMATTKEEYYNALCRWKDTSKERKQRKILYGTLNQNGLEHLKVFRNNVSEGVSEFDLEHILWQIGKKSSENITSLLSKLTKSRFDQNSSLSENVCRALPELLKWTKGNHTINPAVTLSLQSDDLCIDDMYFFKVSDKEKRPLEKAEIKQHVRNVSKAHCQKITSIISKRYKEGKIVSTIIAENETDLFNTYQMIKEWLDEQKCSNYEKRNTLRDAVEEATKASTSSEINVDEIEQLASSKGNAEAAYDLLMKDIKPFATILGLDESKLSNYRQQSSSFQSTQGTIGLVRDVTQKKGKI